MDRAGSKTVTDAEGVCGRVVPASPEVRSTAAHMVVQLDNGPQVLVPTHLLIPQPEGSYALPCRLAALAPAGSEHRVHQDAPLVIPVLVEEREVQKRVVETGKVRLTKVSTSARPWSMNPCGASTSSSRVSRWSGWWRGPCLCGRRRARRCSRSWKRCWS